MADHGLFQLTDSQKAKFLALLSERKIAVDRFTSAVVSVGGGCGLIKSARGKRYVVTARHCLSRMPRTPLVGAFVGELMRYDHEMLDVPLFLRYLPKKPITRQQEREFRRTAVALQPVLIHGTQDIAVLAAPHEFRTPILPSVPICNDTAADAFLGSREALILAPPPATERFRARLLSLDGTWFDCQVQWYSESYEQVFIKELAKLLIAGMSGSPIIDDSGHAIAVVTDVGREGEGACLARCLPGWLYPSR